MDRSSSKAPRSTFQIDGHEDETFTVFTTRPDTLFGATYMRARPRASPTSHEITTTSSASAVEAYVRPPRRRRATWTARTWTRRRPASSPGAYAINPVNGEKIPIWIADYVLMGYGTGAIMAVPGQDERDFEFAKASTTCPSSGRHRLRAKPIEDGEGVRRARHSPRTGRQGRCALRPARRRAIDRRSSRDGPTAKARAKTRSPGWRAKGYSARAGSTTACATGSSPASATGASPSRLLHD